METLNSNLFKIYFGNYRFSGNKYIAYYVYNKVSLPHPTIYVIQTRGVIKWTVPALLQKNLLKERD